MLQLYGIPWFSNSWGGGECIFLTSHHFEMVYWITLKNGLDLKINWINSLECRLRWNLPSSSSCTFYYNRFILSTSSSDSLERQTGQGKSQATLKTQSYIEKLDSLWLFKCSKTRASTLGSPPATIHSSSLALLRTYI